MQQSPEQEINLTVRAGEGKGLTYAVIRVPSGLSRCPSNFSHRLYPHDALDRKIGLVRQ